MIVDDLFESPQTCPECGGPAFGDLLLAEKKDACYHKVRSRYKVWPSAYASGALVQCRKKGAANWGNKSEGVEEATSSLSTSNSGPSEFRGINIPSELKHPGWREPTWSFQEIAQKLGIPVSALNLLAFKTIGGFPEAVPGIASRYGSKKYYKQSEVKRWVNANNVREKIKQRVAEEQLDEKCWDTHRQAGMKKKGNRMVPNCVPKEGVAEGNVDEGIGSKLAGLGLAGAMALGSAGANARVTPDDQGGYTGGFKPSATATAPEVKPSVPASQGFSKEYLQKAADPNRTGRYMISVEKAQELLSNMQEGSDNNQKIGNMDADQFDAAMARLKQLAGQGPLKTVWDPQKRVYRNVPVAQQSKQQPSK